MTASAAWYHDHTSYQRERMSPHLLDWQNQPITFKDYPDIGPISLPSDHQIPEERFSAILKRGKSGGKPAGVSEKDLSLILRLTCTVTASARGSGGDYYFRSVASAGALYPTEIYLATHQVEGLDDGLYHYALHRSCLYPIRSGDLSGPIRHISRSTGHTQSVTTFFLTAIFFRSAWKYRDRAYRYHLLDTGHLIENLVLAIKGLGLPFRLTYDFDDTETNHLLGLDETKEVVLALVHVPGHEAEQESSYRPLAGLSPKTRNASRVSPREVDYPAVRAIHEAGLRIPSELSSEIRMFQELGVDQEKWVENAAPQDWPEAMSYWEALFRRRSRRNFVKRPLGKDYMSSLVHGICHDYRQFGQQETEYPHTLSIGFIVGQVEEMASGFYLIDPACESLGRASPGSFTETMAHVCLDQAWLTHAAVHFLFLTNLEVLDCAWGPRGYRYAMLHAGRLGQRLYLAATAMGLGCCGIGAFYDGEAADLLGLNQTSRLLYLVAVGPVKSGFS